MGRRYKTRVRVLELIPNEGATRQQLTALLGSDPLGVLTNLVDEGHLVKVVTSRKGRLGASPHVYKKTGKPVEIPAYLDPDRNLTLGQRMREYAKANPDRIRNTQLKKNYGIDLQEYNKLLALQNGLCACCGSDKPGGRTKFFCVDHCHKTGSIRGLLCSLCNTGIGALGDTVEGVSRALAYLTRTGSN